MSKLVYRQAYTFHGGNLQSLPASRITNAPNRSSIFGFQHKNKKSHPKQQTNTLMSPIRATRDGSRVGWFVGVDWRCFFRFGFQASRIYHKINGEWERDREIIIKGGTILQNYHQNAICVRSVHCSDSDGGSQCALTNTHTKTHKTNRINALCVRKLN